MALSFRQYSVTYAGKYPKGVCTADCGLSADEVTLSSMTLVIARAELAVTTNYLMRIS